jgi:hypothetical protein
MRRKTDHTFRFVYPIRLNQIEIMQLDILVSSGLGRTRAAVMRALIAAAVQQIQQAQDVPTTPVESHDGSAT